MPGEKYLLAWLSVDILLRKALQQGIAHPCWRIFSVVFIFFQKIAIAAAQVAGCTYWLGHDVNRIFEGVELDSAHFETDCRLCNGLSANDLMQMYDNEFRKKIAISGATHIPYVPDFPTTSDPHEYPHQVLQPVYKVDSQCLEIPDHAICYRVHGIF